MAQVAQEFAGIPTSSVVLPAVLPRLTLLMWFSALTMLVCVVAASYLAHTGKIARTSYDVQKLQAERDLWRMQNEQLRLELAKVRSLTWVEHEAVGRLKMQKSTEPLYLQLPAELLASDARPDLGRR
jgi:hypothetical protein